MYKKTKITITEGPIFSSMLLYVLPIMATGILQVFYSMADNIVVGQFSGDPNALAAVGSTAALTNLVINLMFGLSSGSGIVVAHAYGANDDDGLSKAVHSSMMLSFLVGIISCVLGLSISAPALTLMGTKTEIMDSATLYMRIICLGIPASTIYNFGSSILRSAGDSKTPLLILSSTGILNVLLNLLFVIVFHMSVAGVALATISSQYLSAIIIVLVLCKSKDKKYALSFSKLRLHKATTLKILRLGIPAGIQGALFSISNIIITSSTNTLSLETVSAKTIATNIEGLLYTAMNAYMHASMTFVGQNFGAKNHTRIKSSIAWSIVQVTIVGIAIGQLMLIFGEELSMFYIDSNAPNKDIVLALSIEQLKLMLSIYFLCGIQEAMVGSLRGLGYSVAPMFVNLVGVFGIRIFWCLVFFPMEPLHNIVGLFLVYPISWIITGVAHAITLLIACKKLKRQYSGTTTGRTLRA